MGKSRSPGLKRPRQTMPADVRGALEAKGLMSAFETRPPYQRNDYLGWISRAKREDTRRRRLDQMLSELEDGATYMKMRWNGPR